MSVAINMNVRHYSKVYQYTLKWTIDNFSKLAVYWKKDSPAFTVEPRSKWHVEFEKSDTTNCLNIHYKNETPFRNSFEAIVSDSNLTLATYEGKCDDSKTDILPATFHQNVIEKLSTETLIFTITLKVWYFQSYTYRISMAPEVQQHHLNTLQKDLKKLHANNISPDITLNIQGETLSARRAVLMARSGVFDRLFQAGMREENTGVVDIVDVSLTAMKALLHFMYSAEVADLDFNTALEVYAAADKYAVLDLKEVCRLVISSKVTLETATEVLEFAKARGDSNLEQNIMQYIAPRYTNDEAMLKT